MITDIQNFISEIPNTRAIMGLDLGTKTIGVAISDRLLTVATPSHVILRKKFTIDAGTLRQFLDREEIGAIVLGLPLNMDGSKGPRVQATRGFAYNLEQSWGETCPPILLWDERLSTFEAEQAMIEANLSRRKRDAKIDAVAAAIILQGALDRINDLRRRAL